MESLLVRSCWVLLSISFCLLSAPARAQLTGVKTIPGDYASVTLAVTALNTSGVGPGGVTFNIAGGYTETISSTLSVTATGLAANPIVFQKDPLSAAANPLITAYTGGTATPASSIQDGIWRLVGSDYVTIRNIDIRDNPLNVANPATMEYGFALYKASSTNGCQNVRVEGCTITLNRVNNASATNPMTEGSAGIIVMNATATSAIVVLVAGVGGGNANNKFYGNTIQNCNIGISMVGATSATPSTSADFNNDVGGSSPTTGNTIINYGGALAAANTATAIRTTNQYGINISYNNINNNNGAGVNHTTTLYGILIGTAASTNSTITNNNITLKGGGTTTNVTAIENNSGSTAANNTINISNNSITNSTYSTATTGTLYGIVNNATPATLNITNNILTGSSTAATSGLYTPIRNAGNVTTNITINGNQIGNGSQGAVTYTGTNSAGQIFISNTGGASTAALSIANNNIQGINYSTVGSGSNTYIFNSATTLSQAITGNTFTSLNVNTSGGVTFISNSVVLSATGTQNINNNSIVTSFNKAAAGGTVTLFTSTATSQAGGVSNNLNNNFSNITLTGGTVMDGWVNTDAGAATKTIQGNTFSNWNVGTSACNAMNINLTNSSNSTTGNTITNISGGGNVTGITTAAGNDKISANTISGLQTSGASNVIGILVTGGTNKQIFGNKIYNNQLNNTSGLVTGISVTNSSVVTANVYNNIIGDLRAPTGNTGTDIIRGISISATSTNSTVNVYYNTIHLSATSSGAAFSTSGVFHTANATSTTVALNLRNNIISNTSVPMGSGTTVALRRSGAALNNYATTSNNNLFYAGSPSASRLLYFDGTNLVQTPTALKTLVAPMESASVTEDLVSSSKFVSTSGGSAFFLHLDPAKPTLAESGGVNITSYTVDFDAQVRQGNTGYAGTGTAPDIGADEFAGTKSAAMTGTYFVGTGQQFTSLTSAGGLFAEINSLGLSSNIIVNVTSDLTEDGSYALTQWVEQGAGGYTITIKPDASTLRTISGNVVAGMVRLNGAKRLIIDGSNGTTSNFLTFRNTNNTGTTGSAFTFINGASNNTISYSNIEAFTNNTTGVILFSTSTGTTGNNSNTINNCSINATVAGSNGFLGIYSLGTTGKENSNNIISNNNIFGYTDRGLDIPATGSTAWTISGNSFYNGAVSGTINYAAAKLLYGIKVSGGSGYSIINNFIGGSAALATGTSATYSSNLGLITFEGVQLTTTSATPASNIKGNTIAGINVSCVPTSTSASSVFMGIETFGTGISIGGPLTGEGNLIGSMTNASSIVTTTTTSTNTFITNVHAINCSSSGGQVIGNRVGGIDLQNIGAAPAATTFRGIYINGATAPTLISTNTIGGSAANSIRFLTTSAPASLMSGITIGTLVTSPFTVNGNTIQNMSFQYTGGTGTNVYGIANNAGPGSTSTLSNNIITANSTAATTANLVGIYSASTSTSVTISGNTISNNSVSSSTSSMFGINPSGSNTPLITVTGNTISGNSSAGNLMSIYNLAVATTVNLNSNTFSGNTITSTTGTFYAVYNQGNVTGAININNNAIGIVGTPAVTYTAANTAAQQIILNTGATATTALTIGSNNFLGIGASVALSSAILLINNTGATLSQTITANTFTNLSLNTTGTVTLIANNVVLSATGTQNVNNNSISGTFAKTGVGNGVVGFSNSSAASPSGAVINHNNNNFSNITVSGATTLTGWLVTDAGASTRNVNNNTFSSWTGGSGAVTAMQLQIAGTGAVSGNTISNITASGVVTGMSLGGAELAYQNTISGLSTSGDVTLIGINVTNGLRKEIYRNKIYNLSKTIIGVTTSPVTGIAVTTVTASSNTYLYNNIIGDLTSPAASNIDAIRGISVLPANTSNVYLYFNTIYINATSTGTNFGTSGVYHIASATATIAQMDMRNNIIANYSTPVGTGRTVAFRRSGTALNNYYSTSNNNLYYAGAPGATRLIYFDGTNADQSLTLFAVRVLARDITSRTEDVVSKFITTTGSSATYLHILAAASSAVKGNASNVSGITTDFDGQIRAGNTGYTGSGSNPDIGADETFGLETTPPTITYTALSNTASTANVTLSSVTITDASGVNVAAGTKPRIYYKRFSDANTVVDNTTSTSGWKYTEATNGASPFSFTIDYTLLYNGATGLAGTIQYFVVAQDNATVPNVGINSGTFAATPASVALTGSAFPLTGTINSYSISMGGTYNVGSTETFTSLTRSDGLFAAINSAGLNTNVTVNITSDLLLEDGAVSLNQWTETGVGSYTLSIRPDAGIPRLVSGNAVTGLIKFNGADRVTVDGRNGGIGPFLKFRNTNTAGTTGTAFTFINGATNNVIQYTEIEAYADASNGVILFSTSSAATGNITNTIDNSSITATVGSNTGLVGIYSAGTTGKENTGISITNSNIASFRDRGIDVAATGSSAWTITGNSFYNGNVSSSINYPASSALQGVRILGGAGYSILNNHIGGSSALASGTASYSSSGGNVSYVGILLTTNSATASNIKGNTITGISLSSVPTAVGSIAFEGIETNGQAITIGGSVAGEGNTIGSTTNNSAITVTTSTTSAANTTSVTGINCSSTGGSIVGNSIGGIDVSNIGSAPAASTITGIRVNSTTAPTPVNTNVIGGTTTNSIRVLPASTALATVINGIATTSSVTSAITFNGNTITNISSLSTTSSGTFSGISNQAASTAAITISNNTVQAISGAGNISSSSGVYTGIYSQSASTINTNLVDNIVLNSTGNAAQVRGVWTSGSVAHTLTTNTISNLSAATTKTSDVESSSPTEYAVIGILSAGSGATATISGNILTGFNATSASTINTTVGGIGVIGTSTGPIFNNKLNNFNNKATGTAILPGIDGISAFNGSMNAYNNVISINNSNTTNRVRIYGIIHATSNTWGYYFNSILVAGNASGAAKSSAFIRTSSGTVNLRDNILANTRTGTGPHYGISNAFATPATNWTNASSNYNDIYSATTTAEWGPTASTFAQWQASSGGDANSVNKPVTFINTTDLQPDPLANCTISNTGTPVTTPVNITTDIANVTRDATQPDIGAYEFNYVTFAIVASNNSPVCNASPVTLNVDPGAAINPTFSWSDPGNNVVSTLQNPSVAATAGIYKITVTDATGCAVNANTSVTTLARPTASITGTTTICSGSTATITLTGTGTGTLNGALNSGDGFNGTSPSFTFGVSPTNSTVYTLASLSDDNCAALPQDLTGTVTVSVTASGQWNGTSSADWNDNLNWCGGTPLPTTNVRIVSGTPFSPQITGAAVANDLTLDNGAILTMLTTALLDLKGDFNNNGTLNPNNGTLSFSGSNIQNLTSSTTLTLNNLTVTNTSSPGLRVQSNHNLRGVLTVGTNASIDVDGSANTSVFTMLSTGDSPTQDASIAALPSGASVTGNITIQRFMSLEGINSRMYRYISSPLQNATVADIQNEIPITGTFTGHSTCTGCLLNPSMYQYNEQVITNTNGQGGIDFNDGYVPFPVATNTETLAPGRGYAMYVRGNIIPSARWDVRGVINAANVTPITFPVSFTASGNANNDGFNLIGNPFPSTMDWNASSGWTKTNVGASIYTSDNASGITQYSTWNGVTGTNGGTRYVAMGQAFWIKASATPQLRATESVKAAGTQTTLFREGGISNILRITMSQGIVRDETVVHLRDDATNGFDEYADAIKLGNTSFNLSTIDDGNNYLAINSTAPLNCTKTIKLSVSNAAAGSYQLSFTDVDSFEDYTSIVLIDNFLKKQTDLRSVDRYTFAITTDAASAGNDRFSVMMSVPTAKAEFNLTAAQACPGEDVALHISNSQQGAIYKTAFSDGTITGNGSDVMLLISKDKLHPGANSIKVTASMPGCDHTEMKAITIEPLPDVAVTASQTQLLSNYTQGNQWYVNDAPIDGATQQSYQPTRTGSYHVEVRSGDCVMTSNKTEFAITGLEEEDHSTQVVVSPNPTKDKVTIFVGKTFGRVNEIRISNVLGQIVGTVPVKTEGDHTKSEYSMANLPPGKYLIHITGEHSVAVLQLIRD